VVVPISRPAVLYTVTFDPAVLGPVPANICHATHPRAIKAGGVLSECRLEI